MDTATQTPTSERIEELIIRSARQLHQPLPVLEVIFDRFVLALGPVMKSYCSGTPADAELKELSYHSCGETLDNAPSDWLAFMGSIGSEDNPFGVILDPNLLFTTMEIMLGGRSKSTEEAGPWVPRAFSTIEKRLGRRLCEAVLNELAVAFEQVAETRFSVDRAENSPRTLVLAPPSAPVAKIVTRITFDGRGGDMILILPHASFQETQQLLAQPFRGGQLGGDSSWRELLTERLNGTDVEVDAVLHEPQLHLNQILAWQEGDMIDLGITPDHEVTVSCGELDMFRAAVGRRRNGAVALRITREFSEKEDLTDVAFD